MTEPCDFFNLVSLGFRGALGGDLLNNEESTDRERNTERKADVPALYEACDYVHYEGDGRNRNGVRNLSRYVVQVVALTACA